MVSVYSVPAILVRDLRLKMNKAQQKLVTKKKDRVTLVLIAKDLVPKSTSLGRNPLPFLALLSPVLAAFISSPFPKDGKIATSSTKLTSYSLVNPRKKAHFLLQKL